MSNENIGCSQVIYDTKKQKQIIKDLIEEHEQICNNVFSSVEKRQRGSSNIMKYLTHIIGYSMIFKHPAFAEEKECRIVYAPCSNCTPNGYLAKGNRLSPYFVFNFAYKNKDGQLTRRNDFVVEVKLGPRNTSDIKDVEKFLSAHNYTNIKITKSQIPYVG